jgi:NAD(P)-dependent dehydrogenase (short-subunit alcohol dehydrogenase family)
MKLENRVALITGAGRGIGRAIAGAFASEGAKLALAARTRAELDETARMVQNAGAETLVVLADVTDESDVKSMVEQTLARFQTIDILVNSAGIAGPVGPVQANDVSEWVRTVQVNLIGSFLCCHAVLPVMLGQDRGRIVNLSGAGATNAWRDMSAYCSSKAAVVRLTETMSLELAETNVRVNVLGPGSVHTRMWEEILEGGTAAGNRELRERGEMVTTGGGASIDRAAELAVYLASDELGELNGRLISATSEGFPFSGETVQRIMSTEAFMIRRVELD